MSQTLINYPSDTNRIVKLAAPGNQLNGSAAALNASLQNLTDAIAAAQAVLATLNSAATDPNISSDGSGHLTTTGLTTSKPPSSSTFPHCFLFNGSTYATASAAALNGWTEQTIAFWMWSIPAVNGGATRLVEKGANTEWTICIVDSGGTIRVQQPGNNMTAVQSGASVCDGNWHLIAVTIDSTGLVELFVDNISQGTYAGSLLGVPTDGALNIAQYGDGDYNFTGAMNEITII